MTKVAINKSSLAHQRSQLRLFQRFLPSLDLKRQQLLIEQAVKGTVAVLKMMAIPEGVPLPLVFDQIEDGAFKPKEINGKGADAMLAELAKWAEALKPMRG